MLRVEKVICAAIAAAVLAGLLAGCSANLRFDVDQAPSAAKQPQPQPQPAQPQGWTPPDRYRG